jgi:hypothetical protein
MCDGGYGSEEYLYWELRGYARELIEAIDKLTDRCLFCLTRWSTKGKKPHLVHEHDCPYQRVKEEL